MVAPRAKTAKRVLRTKKQAVFGAAVKIFKAYAEEYFEYRKRGASGSDPKFGYKKIRNAFAFRIHVGCPTRIRTPTNRVRVCRATVTQ